MHKKYWSALLIIGLLSLSSQIALSNDPNFYTSIIVSDIITGAPVAGGTFTTHINLSVTNNSTPPVGIMGMDLWLRFDDTVLAVDDADDNPANGIQVEIATEFFGGSVVVAANEITTCPDGGACVHLALSHTGNPITENNGKVAAVTWAAIATGDAGLQVSDDSVLADVNGASVLINSVSAPTIKVVDPGVIQGTIERQGTRTDHAGVMVVAYATDGGVVANSLTGSNGSFSLNVPRGGTYLVQASYNGYLKAQRNNVYIVGASVDLGTATLPGGDINADNNVNILDIVTLINRYGSSGWPASEPSDINDDGLVNIFDLTIAAGNFGRYGPVTW